MISTKRRIVILGGGFGGVFAAKRLEKLLAKSKDVEIVLISDQNYLLFTPMLPEVPSSSIEAKHIVSPIRAFFRRAGFMNAEVLSIDLTKKTVTISHCRVCGSTDLTFDHLVLAFGSRTNFFGLPGVSEHAMPMKTLSDAMRLRNHIIGLLEHADMQPTREARKAMLTFVVAGGGFAGVETLAELADFIKTARHFYRNIQPDDVRMVLVNSGPRILPEISESLATYATRQLRKNGIDVLLRTRVASAASGEVELSTGETIPTQTLVWTAGVTPSPLLATLPCSRNKRGQAIVNEFLEIPESACVWALGDCAEILDPISGQPCPPTAQHAIREARAIADNIAASIQGAPRKPFRYNPLGFLAALGRRSAVAEILGFRFSGFIAWWLWRTIYLAKLPGFERKVRVAIDWTLDLIFPRDTALIKMFMKQTPSETPADEVAIETELHINRETSVTGAAGRLP